MLQFPEPENKENIITVSPSQLGVWNDCSYKWKLTYLDGWTAGRTLAMARGSLLHEFIEALYNRHLNELMPPVSMDELNEILNSFQEPRDAAELSMFYWAFSTFSRYCEFATAKDDFIPLATELELWAPTDLEFDNKQVFLHGILDLVVDRAGEIGIVDHKTYSSERGKWTADLVYFDQQLAFYMLMMHLLGVTPTFGMINGLNSFEYKQPQPLEKLFSREEVYHKPNRLLRYRDNIYFTIRQMRTADSYPKRLTRNCAYCGYKNVCDTELRGLDYVSVLKSNHRRDVEPLTAEFPLELETGI